MSWLEGQDRWLPTDWLRVAIAVSVPAAYLVASGPAAAAMLLALGGTMALRFARMSVPADVVGQAVLGGSAWFAAIGAYQVVPGLDLASHLASGAVLALLTRTILLRSGLLPAEPGGRAARVLHVTTAVAMLGLLWELGEWAGHAFITPDIGVGYEDTLTDLVADAIGALIAAIAVEAGERRERGRAAADAATTGTAADDAAAELRERER
ncbi:hypothetical protein [Agrococcus sp. Marseille-Q4369]|uniref:hypothetical protein n=1 Tax=Agrococcus sp. Marseille-Q4369 TaxID=2810513 RepID=UPI001B8B7137|nr:hypothetical protein [Agrococcus sp. Marseille-Q4369]QUW19005.1 hypothetical protein JSQ78_01105 [Agrococcus sp. Marseille-Q4369]